MFVRVAAAGGMAGAIAILLLGGATAALAQSASMSGIVMQASGGIEPAVKAFGELPAEGKFQLAQGAKLTFVHYRTCKQVTVEGGTLNLSLSEYEVGGGGKIASEAPRPCPRQQRLAQSGEAASLVMRSGGKAMEVQGRPVFVLVGDRADSIKSGEIRDGSTAVASCSHKGARLECPIGTDAKLQPGKEYSLKLLGAGARAEQEISFVTAGGSEDALVVLRVN